MTVIYEWDCETQTTQETDEHEAGEVIDHRHGESYAQVAAFAAETAPPGTQYALVLVRDDDAGRSWAYVENGKLPEFFHDADGAQGARVPKRFHAEVARSNQGDWT
jgi:hypothetical protein